MSPLFLIFDAICLTMAIGLMWRKLSLLNPLTIYIFFHVYAFTYRAWEIYFGAPTMYSIGYSSVYEPITENEIVRALITADIGLVLFALGIWLSWNHVSNSVSKGGLLFWKPLSIPITKAIFYFSITVGAALFYILRFRGSEVSFGALSTYASVSTMWPITGLIGLYFIDKKFWLVAIPILTYLSVVSVQGFHRFMLVLPIFSLIATYLFIHRKKWPPFHQWVLITLVIIIFPYLKFIGQSMSVGDFKQASDYASQAFTDQTPVEFSNEGFLDQYAGFLAMTDNYGTFEYGKTYLSIITLPIPRDWWADKPGLGDHIIKRSTLARPYDKEGRVISYLGESYVNFGYLGLVIVPLSLGYLLGTFYARFVRLPEDALAALTYIFVASSFLQGFRDGATSFILFGFVFNMPLLFAWVLHAPMQSRPLSSRTII